MNRFAGLSWLLLSQPTWAHHTKDHLMLAEDAEQVIAATREGGGSDWVWLIWAGVTVILLLGFVRWWRNRK
jgi:LPXTG-motif cell wall-anchored protein